MHEAILHYSPWFENVQRAAVENSSHGCFALLARIFSSCHFAPEGQIVSTTSFALFSMSRCRICNNALRTPANTQDLHVVFAETHSVRYLPGLFLPKKWKLVESRSSQLSFDAFPWPRLNSWALVRSRQISSAKALALDWQNGPPTCDLRSGRRRPRLRPLALLITPFSTQKIEWKHRDRTSAETSKFEFGPWPQLMMRPKACVWLFSASISSPEQEVKICPEFGFVLNPCAFSALDGFAKDVLCRNFENVATRSGNNSSPFETWKVFVVQTPALRGQASPTAIGR